MANPAALIVDDEPDILELIEITLGRMNVDTEAAGSLRQAREHLSRRVYDLCLTDMRLPDGDGIDLVRHVARTHPRTPVAVFTAHGNMDTAVEALKAGAFDFVAKPVDLGDLRQLVDQALRVALPGEPRTDKRLIGESDAMQRLRRRLEKAARSQAPIAISGESGVGKELVARSIHEQSPRAAGPFVPVNCGAIPGELMESEFFGHARGSFTGAVTDKEGLFATASGGTLFLDEIPELPADMQVKLLRAIQEKRIRPVGATREIPVDVRLLSAGPRDLAEEVAAGRLRQDLFYRINVIELRVPPLRERADDIGLLAEAILERLTAAQEQPAPKLGDEAHAVLRGHAFPGNVRELENLLERAIALTEGDIITPDDLDPGNGHIPPVDKAATLPDASPATAGDAASLDFRLDNEQRRLLVDTLERHRWNRTEAAHALGLTYRQLRYRLKKLDID